MSLRRQLENRAAPSVTVNFGHLFGNSLWFLPLSWLVLAKSRSEHMAVWLGTYRCESGLTLAQRSHGLSGVVFALWDNLTVIVFWSANPCAGLSVSA